MQCRLNAVSVVGDSVRGALPNQVNLCRGASELQLVVVLALGDLWG